MNQAQGVVACFGGAPKMATTTPYGEQTIRNWLRAGRIPQGHWLPIIQCRASAPTLTLWHFVGEILSAAGPSILAPIGQIPTPGGSPASSAEPA